MGIFKKNFAGKSQFAQLISTKGVDEWKQFLTESEREEYDHYDKNVVSYTGMNVWNCFIGAALLGSGNPLGVFILGAGVAGACRVFYTEKRKHEHEMNAISRMSGRQPLPGGKGP